MHSTSSASSPSTPSDWLERIASVQAAKATPEQMESMRARSEAARRTALTAKRASRMQKSLHLSSSAWHQGMSSASATPERASSVACSAMMSLSSPAFLSPTRTSLKRRSVEEEEAEEQLLEDELSAVAQQHVSDGAIAMDDMAAAIMPPAQPAQQQAQQRAQQQKLDEALAQLEIEPADASQCAAKFQLFEGFSQLTADARQAVNELWLGAQADLDAAGASACKAQIEREIAAVDSERNLGIVDEPHRWFVHGMCRAAVRNQRVLDGVLGGISTKLQLLSSQSECPICFEPFGDERPPTTLSCAHKACAECWGHWCAMAPGQVAPCPLCRHEEFFSRVMRAAGRA